MKQLSGARTILSKLYWHLGGQYIAQAGLAGLAFGFTTHRKGDIVVENILSGWKVWGKTPLKITFRPDESELVQDDAEGDE